MLHRSRWIGVFTFALCIATACGSDGPAPETASASDRDAPARSSSTAESTNAPSTNDASVVDDVETVVTSTTIAQAPSTTSTASTTDSASTSTAQQTPETSTAAPTTAAPAPTPSATLPPIDSPAPFSGSVDIITDETKSRLTHSWREGCPVSLEDLRLVTVTHWNYAGVATTGELVIHADHASNMVDVFRTLYDARFPIERMELVDQYNGDDDLSMAANNTSAFNCREVAWRPGVWSNHAFGTAIDINPLVNPYVSTTRVLPPEGAPFVDRSVEALGGLYPGDVATTALAEIGWIWGGTWSSAKDWQHFSVSGG